MNDLGVQLTYYTALDACSTETDLLEFLATAEPENQVLNYKLNLDAMKLVSTIAAYAHGYGGYLVIGVPELEDDGRIIPGEPTGLPGDPWGCRALR